MKPGWELKTLGDLFDIGSSKRVLKSEWTNQGVPFFRAREIVKLAKNGFVENDLFISEAHYQNLVSKYGGPKAGDLMVSAVGTLGKCYEVKAEDKFYYKDASVICFHPKVEIISKFIEYAFQTQEIHGQVAAGEGATVGTFTIHRAKNTKLRLPPLEEQQRIVSILDEAFKGLDRARENAEANVKSARELFESFVSEQLISVNAEEYSLSEMLEKGWIISHLDGNHGGNYPKKSEFISSGVPYISANCIVDGEIEFALSKFLSEERANTLKKGTSYDQDVIFAHNATVGPVSVLKTDQPRILLGTSLTHYRCNQDRIDPYFLCYEMRSAEFVAQYKGVMEQATRNQVPISIQRSFKHRIPNLKDQMRVSKAARTTEINVKRSLALYQTKLQDISDLRRSLLQKAFAGELT